jgi:tRNA(Met) cytidine acetyltransferase
MIRSDQHRSWLVACGTAAEGALLAEQAMDQLGVGPDRVHATRVHELIGRSRHSVTVDGHAGLDPDLLGAAAGAVAGGGALVLLMPHRPWRDDPWAERLASWPHTVRDVRRDFLARLARVLEAAPGVTFLEPGVLPPEPETGRREAVAPPAATADQARAIADIVAALSGSCPVPAVLIADRGRGKSSALGLAVEQLEGPIAVTGPGRGAAAEVLARAEERGVHADWVEPRDLRGLPRDRVLLVDEAAALPAELLWSAARRFRRVAFASTVHGYEGTGRGFEVRFLEELDRLRPGWRRIELAEPIRWAPGDPVEAALNTALLLAAEPSPAAPGPIRYEALPAGALVNDESTLRAVVGLLVQAHYRTRPSDVRRLMDAPNMEVLLARAGDAVAGVVLLAREGGFERDQAEAIITGRLRPKGHLLPETLACHLGEASSATLRSARIVRIAVHSDRRREGIGLGLLNAVEAHAQVDLLGSSFGATRDLLRFWSRAGYRCVRCGVRPSAVSGLRSSVVLRAASAEGRVLVERLRERLARHFPDQLPGALRDLDARIVLALGDQLQQAPDPTLDEDELLACAFGPRAFDAAPSATLSLVRHALAAGHLGKLKPEASRLLVGKVLQRRSFHELSVPGQGLNELMRRFRAALADLVEIVDPQLAARGRARFTP